MRVCVTRRNVVKQKQEEGEEKSKEQSSVVAEPSCYCRAK